MYLCQVYAQACWASSNVFSIANLFMCGHQRECLKCSPRNSSLSKTNRNRGTLWPRETLNNALRNNTSLLWFSTSNHRRTCVNSVWFHSALSEAPTRWPQKPLYTVFNDSLQTPASSHRTEFDYVLLPMRRQKEPHAALQALQRPPWVASSSYPMFHPLFVQLCKSAKFLFFLQSDYIQLLLGRRLNCLCCNSAVVFWKGSVCSGQKTIYSLPQQITPAGHTVSHSCDWQVRDGFCEGWVL